MTSLANHHAGKFSKLMLLGHSGTGKTGALASLVGAGYNLRILDMDNGLDALRQIIGRDYPDRFNAVDFETRRDKYKATPTGSVVKGQPKAFVDAHKLMEKWSDESDPSEWGPDTVFVLDSLTSFGKAAFEWARGMNPTCKDPRQWYGTAQDAVENALSLLTSEDFHANLIVITHVDIREQADGMVKGFPTAIGKALGPAIPRYFNTLVLAESSGSGKNVKRKIKTFPTDVLDLKVPGHWNFDYELPLETGLATIFQKLKETRSA